MGSKKLEARLLVLEMKILSTTLGLKGVGGGITAVIVNKNRCSYGCFMLFQCHVHNEFASMSIFVRYSHVLCID